MWFAAAGIVAAAVAATPSGRGARVVLGPTGGDSIVDVPLVRGQGDPRPRVEVQLTERGRPVLAVVDLGGDTVRIGARLAIRSGLRIHGRGERRADIGWLRIGDVVVTGVSAVVTSGEDLLIGVGGIVSYDDAGRAELGIAVLPSRGVVRFHDDPDALLADFGPPLAVDPGPSGRQRWWERGRRAEGTAQDALPVAVTWPDGATSEVWLALASDRPRTLFADRDPADVAPSSVSLGPGAPAIGVWPRRDESIVDPRPQVVGVLGADALAGLDVAVDPSGGIAVRPADAPTWTDAARAAREAVEVEAAGWSAPAVTAPDPEARRRYAELAAVRFADGDVAGAEQADEVLERVAGTACDVWLAIAERRLRGGAGDPMPALDRAVDLYSAWFAVGVDERNRIRLGGRGLGAQPVVCERAAGLRALLGGPPVPWDDLDPGRALAAAFATDRPEGPLRTAVNAGGRDDPGVRAALARELGRSARFEPAVAWVLADARDDVDPHPLTTALVVGRDVVDRALAVAPDWLAGRLVAAAWRAEAAEPSLVDAANARWRVRPGDPAAGCALDLATALVGAVTAPPSASERPPEADCVAAEVLAAVHAGDPARAADAYARLAARWPDRVSARWSADDAWLVATPASPPPSP